MANYLLDMDLSILGAPWSEYHLTEHYYARLEEQARDNIKHEISLLRAS